MNTQSNMYVYSYYSMLFVFYANICVQPFGFSIYRTSPRPNTAIILGHAVLVLKQVHIDSHVYPTRAATIRGHPVPILQ